MKKYLFGFALMSLSASIWANTDTILRPSFDACMERSAGVTVEMLNCNADENNYQDKRLNKVYQQLIKQLPSKRRLLLRDTQRMWLSFRKSNCSLKADPNGGTAESLVLTDCYLTSTAARAQELEDLKTTIDSK